MNIVLDKTNYIVLEILNNFHIYLGKVILPIKTIKSDKNIMLFYMPRKICLYYENLIKN